VLIVFNQERQPVHCLPLSFVNRLLPTVVITSSQDEVDGPKLSPVIISCRSPWHQRSRPWHPAGVWRLLGNTPSAELPGTGCPDWRSAGGSVAENYFGLVSDAAGPARLEQVRLYR
jgi:hypothetical protein